MFVFAWMLHVAGAETFLQGLGLAYIYIFALFVWDTFSLIGYCLQISKESDFPAQKTWTKSIIRNGSM